MKKSEDIPKIIQIISHNKDTLIALCEDGLVWKGEIVPEDEHEFDSISWQKMNFWIREE